MSTISLEVDDISTWPSPHAAASPVRPGPHGIHYPSVYLPSARSHCHSFRPQERPSANMRACKNTNAPGLPSSHPPSIDTASLASLAVHGTSPKTRVSLCALAVVVQAEMIRPQAQTRTQLQLLVEPAQANRSTSSRMIVGFPVENENEDRPHCYYCHFRDRSWTYLVECNLVSEASLTQAVSKEPVRTKQR